MLKLFSIPSDLPRPLKLIRIASKITAILGLLILVPLLFIQLTSGSAKDLAGMAIDSQDNLYISDGGNAVIKKYSSQGNLLKTWGSRGSGDGQFGPNLSPGKLAVGPDNVVYVMDGGNQRVQKFDSNGNFLTKWGINEKFYTSENIATDGQGQVYVFVQGIQKFDSNGNYLGTLSANLPDSVKLNSNSGMAEDDTGIIFVTSQDNNIIYTFTGEGKISKVITLVGANFPSFYSPNNLVVDHQGNFYFSSRDNNQILKFDRDGKFVTTWNVNTSNDNLSNFSGMVVDSRNNLYILNDRDEKITVFDSNGQNLRDINIDWYWLTKNSFFFTLGFSFLTIFMSILEIHYRKKYNIQPTKKESSTASSRAGKISQITCLVASLFGMLIAFPMAVVFSVIDPGSIATGVTPGPDISKGIAAYALLGLYILVLIMVSFVKKAPLVAGIVQIGAGFALFFLTGVLALKVLPIAIIIGGALAILESNETKAASGNSQKKV